jgi:5-methyltetrahydrofolate--homocysteine methyltransferase
MSDEHDLIYKIKDGDCLFDGAMGSMLIAKGLKPGSAPEEWNLLFADIIYDIHKLYLEAGASVITTNTFGGTPSRLAGHGLAGKEEKLNNLAIQLARGATEDFEKRAADKNDKRFVAFSLGPTGLMLPPVGKANDKEIRREYSEQLKSIREPVDLILIETIFDLREGLLALWEAQESAIAPVAITMTFEKRPRGFYTIMGNSVLDSISKLEEQKAEVVGANCSITSIEMIELARALRESTSLPILCQPNAGNPVIKDGRPVYEQKPEEFAADAMAIFDEGINAVGGCCGSTPDFIREISTRLADTR